MTMLYILNGLEMGQSFELQEGSTYIGRAPHNDIQIADKTVSREHLRITKKGDKYSITDLKSRNGTFLSGHYAVPSLELPINEGVPIAIGMSIICLGEGCMDHMLPFLNSTGVTRQTRDESGIFEDHRDQVNQKKLEFLYKVSDVLMEQLPIRLTLQKILDSFFGFLKRIDRGAFILLDPETKEIREIVFRSKKPTDNIDAIFCQDIVHRVLQAGKPIVVSDTHTEEGDIADTLKIFNIESVMCVPLVCSAQTIGAIYVDSLERPYGFHQEDLSLFMDLSQRTALAVEASQFLSEVSDIADDLSSES